MQNDFNTNESVEQQELALLADFVMRPKPMARYAAHHLITAHDFTVPAHRTAWDHLINASHDDPVLLQNFIRDDLQLTGKRLDKFLDLSSTTDTAAEKRVHELAMLAYQRKTIEAVHIAMQDISDCANPEAYNEKALLAMQSVPKPPSAFLNAPAPDETAALYGDLPEIPSDLLHVPGFIDALVDYSMRIAYKPNRTLAFAGALALLAHLAGRLFTDRRNTRTNLYIIAAGHSGIGKESPRRVNRTVLSACSRCDTVLDQTGSGEALEEALYRKPCLLFQMDEIQKQLLALRDGRNVTAINIIKYLNNLYSASGSVHTLRPKATAMNEFGRVVVDPSLTLFGTGIAHGIYQALTPEIIEDGFLGRCLVFDTDFEDEANDFDSDVKPTLPPLVVNQAQELAARHLRIGGNRENDPLHVPYADGVNARLKEIFQQIDKYKLKCNAQSEHAGTALWSRAPEKVSKLALIYAISENYVEPVISRAAVEWAWELTEHLVDRMLKRVNIWMTCGRLDELARKVMEFITRNKGSVFRHEVVRKYRDINPKDMGDVERLLEDRGSIQVTQINKKTRKYTLLHHHIKENAL